MLGRILLIWLFATSAAMAQSLPTPTFGNAYVNAGVSSASTKIPVGLTVKNNTDLSALPINTVPSGFGVARLGYSIAGDGPTVLFIASGSACSLNSGAGDGGSQVPSADGKCWILNKTYFVNGATWGMTCNGSTDTTSSFQASVNYIQTVGGTLSLPSGTCMVSAPIVVNPTYQVSLEIAGQGLAGGTAIKPLHSFSGDYVLKFVGPSVANTSLSFKLHDLELVMDTGYGPSYAALGFLAPSGYVVNPYIENPVSDLLIANFPTSVVISNWRLLNFLRVGIWSNNVANAIGWSIQVPSGSTDFTGDINWDLCQFVAGTGTSYAWNFYNTNSSNTIAMAGFKMNYPVIYNASYGFYLNNAGSSEINDVWITNGQNDGPFFEGLNIDSNGSGGSINNVHYVGNYHTAPSGPIVVVQDSNTGAVNGVFINKNWSVGGTNSQISIFDGTGGGSAYLNGVNISENIFESVSIGTAITNAAIFLSSGTNIVAVGNQLVRKGAASIYSMFTIGGGVAGALISSNNAYGYASATGWTGTVVNFSGSTTIVNNIP